MFALLTLDATGIVNIISMVGFPIACCIALGWYVARETRLQREETKALNEEHTREMLAFKDEMKEALNNNTIALTKLCDKLEDHKGVQNGL